MIWTEYEGITNKNSLITRPEESYRLWRVDVCDQENLVREEAIAPLEGCKIQTHYGF
jgi:hypothetical protein